MYNGNRSLCFPTTGSISLYIDNSAATAQRCREFSQVITTLQNHNIQYRWGFPAKLIVTFQNQATTFYLWCQPPVNLRAARKKHPIFGAPVNARYGQPVPVKNMAAGRPCNCACAVPKPAGLGKYRTSSAGRRMRSNVMTPPGAIFEQKPPAAARSSVLGGSAGGAGGAMLPGPATAGQVTVTLSSPLPGCSPLLLSPPPSS